MALLAAYAGWVWWKLLREEPGLASEKAGDPGPEPTSAADEAQAKELKAYNRYLAGLSAADRPSKE